jgi:GTP-binding protein EngB required for normal cell division
VDGNISPQKIDLDFMGSLEEEKLLFCIVVTKIDKASQKVVSQNVKLLKQKVQAML